MAINISGAAANFGAAARSAAGQAFDQKNLGLANLRAGAGAIRQVGQDFGEMQGRKRASQTGIAWARTAGVDESIIASGDPVTILKATLAKVQENREAQQFANQQELENTRFGNEKTMFGMEGERQDKYRGFGRGGYDPGLDPYVKREAATGEAVAGRQREMSELIGGQMAELGAPVEGFGGFAFGVTGPEGFRPPSRPAGPDDVMGRAAGGRPGGGSYMKEALLGALGATPTPSRARNIDPLSPEGIAAEEEKAKRLGAVKPTGPARMNEEDRIRLQFELRLKEEQEKAKLRGLIDPKKMQVLELQKRRNDAVGLGADDATINAITEKIEALLGMGGAQRPAVDPARKAKLDEIQKTDPARYQKILQQMTPEERAAVGR